MWLRGPARTDHQCSRHRERGQTLPLICVMFVGLLGLAGMVLDLGDGYFQRRSVQNVADAAALAGAEAIPTGNWSGAAQLYAAKNDAPTDQVSVSYNGSDTVTVTVTRKVPTYLLSLLGTNSLTVTSRASATVEAVGQVKGHVAPYAVTEDAYANGAGTSLFTESSPGAYGTIDLPTTSNTTGGSCSGSTNKGTQQTIADELAGSTLVGEVVVGGCLSLKPGASQPSAKVVQGMLPGDNQLDSDLQSLGNGTYKVIPRGYDINGLPPRLLYVPIVDQLAGGSSVAYVKRFAWFYITGTSGGGNSLTILGKFVTLQLPPTAQVTSYLPGAVGQVFTAELTA